jgi:putative transposase
MSPFPVQRRWHLAHASVGTGPVYQGRYKSFPVQQDEHFYAVCRYVERNALRANLVADVRQWRWSSPWHRANKSNTVPLADWPLPRGKKWVEFLNRADTDAELQSLRRSAWSGRPYGQTVWVQRTARRLGLESTLRPPGRPKATGQLQRN